MVAAHRAIQQRHRCHTKQRLGTQKRIGIQAKDLNGQHHRPQRQRCLIHRDRISHVGGAEEESRPVIGTCLGRSGVETIAIIVDRQVPEVQNCSDKQQGNKTNFFPRQAPRCRIALGMWGHWPGNNGALGF